MLPYQTVKSSLEISRTIADYLEQSAPDAYPSRERAKNIHRINDTLQGRSDTPAESLFEFLVQLCDSTQNEKVAAIRRDFCNYSQQKTLLSAPYEKQGHQNYKFSIYLPIIKDRQLKIIDQQLYDLAAKEGFPPGFFEQSYFDHVTFYCLPDHADFYYSTLQGCTFAVCRMDHTSFEWAHIDDTDFHSCHLERTAFRQAHLTHCRFYDCQITCISFNSAILTSCSMHDCALFYASFTFSVLDGCSFVRIQARFIYDLESAQITMRGATEEECRINHRAVLQALSCEKSPQLPKEVGAQWL